MNGADKKRAAAPRSHYGRPPKQGNAWSGKLIAIGAVVFVVFAAVTVIGFFQRREAQNFDPVVSGFGRSSDTVVTVDVDVKRKKPDEPAVCIVDALDYSKTEVGRREFLIPGDGQTMYHQTVDIPSRGVPVIGRVYGCSETIPAYLTATVD